MNDIDHSMYVLNVDLWSQDGQQEVNLVRHSATSPSISATTPVSYQQTADSNGAYAPPLPPAGQPNMYREPGRDQYNAYPQQSPNAYGGQSANGGAPYNPYNQPPSVNPYGQGQQQHSPPHAYPQDAPYPQQNPNNGHPQSPYPPQQPQQQGYYGAPPPSNAPNSYRAGIDYAPVPEKSSRTALTSHNGQPFTSADLNIHRQPISTTPPTGMFTRNLIGSLACSAFRLTDPTEKIGIWFILQDLSVRTEGLFRYVSFLLSLFRCSSIPSLRLQNITILS